MFIYLLRAQTGAGMFGFGLVWFFVFVHETEFLQRPPRMLFYAYIYYIHLVCALCVNESHLGLNILGKYGMFLGNSQVGCIRLLDVCFCFMFRLNFVQGGLFVYANIVFLRN